MSIAPERHIFMGNLYFYEKIISPMKGMFGKGKMPKMLKIMLMGSMMKDMDVFGDDLFGDFDAIDEAFIFL